MNSAGSSLGSEFHTSQGLPVDDGPHPRCRLGCPLRPCPGQLGVPQCPPLSTPQLLLTSPLSFLFPIIFLEIVLLAAPLPGQLALLPLSRAGGGRSPAPPPGERRPRVSARGGLGQEGCLAELLPAPAPEALWVSCGFLSTPRAKLCLFLTAPGLPAPAQRCCLWSRRGFAAWTSCLPGRPCRGKGA